MIREFEGKTEQEAVENALAILGKKRDEINIELVAESKHRFLFGKSKVKIKVFYDEISVKKEPDIPVKENKKNGDLSVKIADFLHGVINRMGIEGNVNITSKDDERIIFNIETRSSGILIGRKGKTLDSLQLLINVFAGKLKADKTPRLIIDTEDYRARRERGLISYAHKAANQVRRTRSSVLLDAMNPFDRRLVHTTLNNLRDVETVSEGDGLYKKIRVRYKGKR